MADDGRTISFMHTEQLDRLGSGHGSVTRRAFVGTTLAGGAALLTGGITSLFHPSSAAAAVLGDDGPIIEATIPELQTLMASGALTSRHSRRDISNGSQS